MIHWTEFGAVAAPDVVDIDAEGWAVEELAAELHYWLVGRRGPRSVACTSVVLRGVSPATVAAVLPDARSQGLVRIGAWARPGDVAAVAATGVDLITVDGAQAVDEIDAVAVPVAVRWDLAAGFTDVLERVTPELTRQALCIVDAAHASAAQVSDAVGRLAGHPDWWWRGWPVCSLQGNFRAVLPSPNRWRVTGARRRGEATLTQPSAERFFRAEGCRFCAARACAGAPWEAWRRGEIAALRPLEEASTRGVPTRYETLIEVAG